MILNVWVDGKRRTTTMLTEHYRRIIQAAKCMAIETRLHRIYDRCFHGKKRRRAWTPVPITQALKERFL